MDITPDLSHLTEDERKIIEAVIDRQKAEEKRDALAIQSRMDDYSAPVAMVGRQHSQSVRTSSHEGSSNESGICCEVCQKTKFVGEQSVRQCSICKKRFCVRCGVRLKGHQYNKTFWLCNICRQKQESYFSSRKLMPTTSSVSQLTTTSINTNNINDENTKNISKQYVSDYILSQPFDTNEKDDDDIKINNNGAKNKINKNIIQTHKRILPTTHIRHQQQNDSSSEQDDGAVSSADSVSAIDDNESLSHGHTLANDNWQKQQILAAKLENFLTTPTTTWRFNDNRTEQIGYVHLKNNTWSPTIRDEYEQGKLTKDYIFSALGLKIQGGIHQENNDGTVTMIAEITKVTPGSIADNCGQLQIADQIVEWNGENLTNLNSNDVNKIISENSLQSADIFMIVKRLHRYSTLSNNEQSLTPPISILSSQEHDTTTKKSENNIRLQLSFQYNNQRRDFLVTVHGARDVNRQQGSIACQLSMQCGRDSLSKDQKCTKPQICSSGICTWNQRLTFFDIDTLDNLSLWVKLVDLDRNQEILGETFIQLNDKNLNLNGIPEWFNLSEKYFSTQILQTKSFISNDNDTSDGSSFNRVLPIIKTTNELLPTMIDTSTASNRKRQLPNIPAAQLHANREKVSQDLIQKATQLKLRLHMQQQQRSFNETNLNEKRQMYEDRIQIFNNEVNRPKNSNSLTSSQRSTFQTSKSIDMDSTYRYQTTKQYESMTNLTQKPTTTMLTQSGLKEKTLSRPRIPIIRDKSAPNTPYLNPSLTRRTTTAGQNRTDFERSKLKSFEEKYRRNLRKRESSETPGDDVDSDGSELSTVSKISSVSMLSTQSERPRNSRKQSMQIRLNDYQHQFHRNDEVQLNEEELRQMAMRTHDTMTTNVPSIINEKNDLNTGIFPSSSTHIDKLTNPNVNNKNDGTLSDSILTNQQDLNKKRRPSMSSKALVILGLSKKANSASNLGYGKRFGFQRSEEIGVQPHLRNRTLQKQTSKENETPTSAPPLNSTQSPLALSHQREQYHSIPNDMKLWSGGLKLPHEHQFAEFIEGLGTGQLVGRQVLASPCHGEIQVGLRDQHGLLEVEIVRARNLLQKAVYKMPPAPYVKVYLLDGKTCVEKQRTRTTRRTLDPLIQQILIFKENYRDRVLQIGVWGDYGKLDRKVFMGVCQINLEELHLCSGTQALDWYKLFSANSLMNNYTIVQQSGKRQPSITTNDSHHLLKTNSRS